MVKVNQLRQRTTLPIAQRGKILTNHICGARTSLQPCFQPGQWKENVLTDPNKGTLIHHKHTNASQDLHRDFPTANATAGSAAYTARVPNTDGDEQSAVLVQDLEHIAAKEVCEHESHSTSSQQHLKALAS